MYVFHVVELFKPSALSGPRVGPGHPPVTALCWPHMADFPDLDILQGNPFSPWYLCDSVDS